MSEGCGFPCSLWQGRGRSDYAGFAEFAAL